MRDFLDGQCLRLRRRKDHGISRVFPRQHGANVEPLRQDGRHVLAAVHREIDVTDGERVFDFFHEQPFAADLRERRFAQPISGRLDDDDLGTDLRVRLEFGRDAVNQAVAGLLGADGRLAKSREQSLDESEGDKTPVDGRGSPETRIRISLAGTGA